MKKLLFCLIFLPLAYVHASCSVYVVDVKYVDPWIGRDNLITLSDGTVWRVFDFEGYDTREWEYGDHVCFWQPSGFDESEFRLINMDTIACVKVRFTRMIY